MTIGVLIEFLWQKCSFLGCCNFYGFLCTFEWTSKIVGFLYMFCSFYPWQKFPKSTDGTNYEKTGRIIILVVQLLALVQARKWLGVDKKMEGEIFDHPQPKFQTEAFWKCSNNFHKRPCNFLLKIPPTDLLQILLLYHSM